MMTQEQIDSLQDACGGCADANWDGSVVVSQDENGCLEFVLYGESGEVHAEAIALPHGETLLGVHLWKFKVRGVEYGEGEEPVATLVPKMICGLLGL